MRRTAGQLNGMERLPDRSRPKLVPGLFGLALAGIAAAACSQPDSRIVTADTSDPVVTGEPAEVDGLLEIDETAEVGDDAAASRSAASPTSSSEVALLSGPDDTTIDRFAEFTFDAESAECSLDNGDFELCDSPVFLPDVEEGTHTFAVRSTDSDDSDIGSSHDWEIVSLWDNPTTDIIPATKQPDAAAPNSWRGIFRINCDFSHSSYDDPIVFPDDEGAAHLHRFYGNTEVDYATTLNSLYGEGVSTCQGNELNLSAYWVPALLSPDDTSDDGWNAVPAVVGGSDEAHEVFYYSAGVDDLSSIQPIPAGLRIIAGDASATPDDPQDTSIVRWHCQSWEANDATNPQFSTTIPECEAPDRVRMDIFFPSCWNGVDLDSDDHQSHMAYPIQDESGTTVCPDSHPVPIVRPSYHYAFGVKPDVYDPATQASTGWRLSADSYTVDADNPGGASLHADWFNGWHPTVMEAILETCIQGRLDCHDGNLANGFRLSDVQEGVQNDPEVINDGMGTAMDMADMHS